MTSLQFISINIADFRRDTRDMSQDEKGAYVDLLIACGEAGGTLNPLWKSLQVTSNLSPWRWRSFVTKFVKLFYQTAEGLWRHGNVDRQLEHIEKIAAQRSVAGKKGMEKRWPKDNERYNNRNNDRYPTPITPAITTVIKKLKTESLTSKTESPKPRPRARPSRVEGQKVKGVFGADPKAGNGHAEPQRSSKPAFKQVIVGRVTPATANLMGQCARYVGPDRVAQFWEDMMGPDASTVLSNTAKAMRDSGWKDPG